MIRELTEEEYLYHRFGPSCAGIQKCLYYLSDCVAECSPQDWYLISDSTDPLAPEYVVLHIYDTNFALTFLFLEDSYIWIAESIFSSLISGEMNYPIVRNGMVGYWK